MSHTARTIFLSLAMLGAGSAGAQGHNPYAGQHERPIKALSEDDTRQYLAGAGMGYARAAELNGYPGPMHVLDLGDKLGLSEAQRGATQRLMETHKAEARAIGAKRVAAEKSLDDLFSSRAMDSQRLAEAVRTASQHKVPRLPAQVVDDIDNDRRPDRDHQDVSGYSDIAVSPRRRADLHDQWARHLVVDDIARQRAAHLPFLRLPGRHAAVVLLGKARRAAA